ncbi:hypothetical protein ACFL16_00485 [Patescibacteria group bacterium]
MKAKQQKVWYEEWYDRCGKNCPTMWLTMVILIVAYISSIASTF